MAKSRELAAMRRAIAISAQGLGSSSPNPPVGCVILDNEGHAVGEGYHPCKGEPHAEVHALAAAGKQAAGGTAVVTLEPCNHYGRTPPCREALIDANVSRVLIAVMDPTSRGDGGAALLRKAGIEVEQDFLRDEALLVLGPWLTSLRSGRPFLTWIYEAGSNGPAALSVDDAIAHELIALRESHDIVIRQGGEIEEGRTGSHGADVFQLPHSVPGGSAAEVGFTLSRTGARSVLIEGTPEVASAIAAAGMMDRVITYLPHTPQSWIPGVPHDALSLTSDGYRLAGVTRLGGYVRIECIRNTALTSSDSELRLEY
ncbi:bifunctional diaminohydroxyphosphoribosylaminopyrimidine deaminase/5-amino-6-(5-phosphoribosylamino)uracil reductase RibD [Streptomyces acidicola]|uniref:bifunctional diaminohydroxyphosphoribosylaminopyrimidine deaminase/5-amino-6-(5-phosphoribosylamino)uracil reductase RibD n=1 Tax=Streptomyces acidicola TaxID=2596892 RepID=UPI0037916AA7